MSEEYGPKLPAHLKQIGPVLPPHLQPASSSKIIGPTLPPHLNKNRDDDNDDENEDDQRSAVVTDEDDEDEEVCGPLPPGVVAKSHTQRALDERALKIKLGYLDDETDKKAEREEWMLALPDARSKNLGFGPRQFRKNAAPDMSDRSSWTDTPDQKAKKLTQRDEKVDLKKEAATEALRKRDREQEKLSKKHNKVKKRDQSLLELHREDAKRKKKEEEQGDKPTRRPFNRDTDLNVNKFDDAQKAAILKKAALLNDRFSQGQSKFL